MGCDGMISPWLARLHPRTASPDGVFVFQSVRASQLILSGTFEQLLEYSGLVLSLFMALTLSRIFRLRRTVAVGSPTNTTLHSIPSYPRPLSPEPPRLEWNSSILFLAQEAGPG